MIVEVASVVLLLAAAALCVALIIYLNRVTKSVEAIQKDIKDLTNQTTPLLHSLHELSTALQDVAEEINGQLGTTRSIINEVKEKFETVKDFERKIREGIDSPVATLMQNLGAIRNGVSTFFQTLRKR